MRDRSELIEEAEILTDSWAAAQNNHRQLELSTALQILLSEQEEICRQIIEIIDAGKTRRVVWRRDPLATLSG